MKKINKENSFTKDFINFSFTCIIAVTITTAIILYLPTLFKDHQSLKELANSDLAWIILLTLPFIGGVLILKIYSKNKKSIKAFNDVLLLGIGVGGVYSILFFGIDAIVKNEYLYNLSSVGVFSIKMLFLMCSFAKVAITFNEFCDERKKEIEEQNISLLRIHTEKSSKLSKEKIGITISAVAIVIYHLINKKK
ncbi:TPA: hypothetical protein PXN09_000243 [Yersinia enterocolitica]|nr:hypothetical protein [Yersinia enterocolitica]